MRAFNLVDIKTEDYVNTSGKVIGQLEKCIL